MAAEILYREFGAQPARTDIDAIDRNLRGLRLQLFYRACRCCLELLMHSDHFNIGAISIEYSLYEKVSPHENVTRHSFSELTERVGDPHHLFNDRHVAVLAGLLFPEVAVQPFLIWHLLRELADLLSSWTQGSGDQRVTGRSEEHTSELQSPYDLVCRLLLEKNN